MRAWSELDAVKSCEKSIRVLAYRFATGKPDFHALQEDLAQEGRLEAIRRWRLFEPERGIPFLNYAYPYLAGSMKHYLRDRYPMVHLPARRQELGQRPSEVLCLDSDLDGDAPLFVDVVADPRADTANAALALIELDAKMQELPPWRQRQALARLPVASGRD